MRRFRLIAACLFAVGSHAAAQEAAPGVGDYEGDSRAQFAEPALADDGASAAPLLSYRRDSDAGVNPLRTPPAAPTAAVVETPPVGESAIGQPRYAVPAAASEDMLPNDADATEPGPAPLVPATPLPIGSAAVSAPAEQTPPVAALDEYDSAPLASLDATPTQAVRSTPATTLASSEDGSTRLLAPPSIGTDPQSSSGTSERKSSLLSSAMPKFKSLSSAGAGLAVVVGLFLLCAWLLRRNGPKPTGVLPEGAFAVLGRAPLTAQSFAQLLRIGNKLVLVAVSSDGAQPLAEVTDPAEVDRIAGLCVSGRTGGSSAEFQQVLAQLSKEPARGFLGREGSSARRRA